MQKSQEELSRVMRKWCNKWIESRLKWSSSRERPSCKVQSICTVVFRFWGVERRWQGVLIIGKCFVCIRDRDFLMSIVVMSRLKLKMNGARMPDPRSNAINPFPGGRMKMINARWVTQKKKSDAMRCTPVRRADSECRFVNAAGTTPRLMMSVERKCFVCRVYWLVSVKFKFDFIRKKLQKTVKHNTDNTDKSSQRAKWAQLATGDSVRWPKGPL